MHNCYSKLADRNLKHQRKQRLLIFDVINYKACTKLPENGESTSLENYIIVL